MASSRTSAKNQPVSHVKGSQGGRTVGEAIQRARGKKKGTPEKRGLRQRVALKPSGKDRFPFGKFVDGTQAQQDAWAAMSLAATKRMVK